MSDEPKARVPVVEQLKGMAWNFWVANIIEAGERLSFFGVRAIVGIYIAGPVSVLDLSMTEKGIIFGIWALIQCLLPMVSGGYTESYGYKKSIYLAFAINICGYLLMANADGFWTMLMAAILVGTGTAIFKPPVQGGVVKALNEGNSGLGFGIFYWIVNIGGFLAPMAAAALRGNEASPTWSHVFYGAAIVTVINYLPAIFLFREPEIDQTAKDKKPLEVFKETMLVLWNDKSMLRFLLIISGFWFMFMQLWDLLPNFIVEWVDARDLGGFVSSSTALPFYDFLVEKLLTADGALKPEMLINIDSAAIILFVLPISWFFGKYKMIIALVIGMAIGLVGFVGAGLFQVGAMCALMIFVFALGEMICSPKFSEYIGMSAPPDKKALYMGYSNIPFAFGWAGGNFLAGPLYDLFSSRELLARRYLVDQFGMSAEAAEQLDQGQLLDTIAAKMGGDATSYDAIQMLWQTYDPWIIWVILGIVGLASLLGMIFNYKRAR